MIKIAITILLLFLPLADSIGQMVFSPKFYVCYRAERVITIDGKLDEPSWQKADWTDNFVDIEGSPKPVPRFRTRAKMLWDDTYLYFGAELEEPDVWATLTQRDAVIFHDNDFEIFIDPDGDTHEYYEFEMNALNTVWDLLLVKPYRDGGPPVDGWDIHGLRTAVSVQGTLNKSGDRDTGWTVEIAYPWKALRECAHKAAPPKSGDQWRVNFSRVEWHVLTGGGNYQKVVDPKTGNPFPEDNWVWSPQGLIDMHYPEMWGFIQFSEKIAGNGTDTYRFRPEENAKWALRRIYYEEKRYFDMNKRFAGDTTVLGLHDLGATGYLPPAIEVTRDSYQATIESMDGKQRWHIGPDGRTWVTQ